MSVRIVYQDIAAGAEEDAAVSAPGAAEFADPGLLPSGGSGAAIATLEPFSWVLDGSRELLDTQQLAYWSQTLSGPDVLFAQPPEITVSFDGRYTAPGLFLTFDPATGDYCARLTAAWYRGESLLARESFSPDGPEYFCARTVEAFDRIVLRLESTGRPYWRAKLSRILFGVARTFLRPELRDVHVVEEVSLLSDQVAVNTLEFTLDSRSDIAYMFQMKQPVSAYDGEKLLGVFYIRDSNRRAWGLYGVSCMDAIGVLDDAPFPGGIFQERPAGELLEEILDGQFALDIPPALAAAPVSGYLPPCTRRQALQQTAFALRAMVDTSGTAAVRVYQDREETPRILPLGRVYTGGSVDRAAIVTAVQVLAHRYSETGQGGETVEADGKTWYHTTEAVEILNPNTTASDKRNVVEVRDATLVTPANAAAVAQHLYHHYSKRDTLRAQILWSGEQPGDHVAVPTPWGTRVDGYITALRVTLSGVAAAECEVVGVDVRSVGIWEDVASGEVDCGEL